MRGKRFKEEQIIDILAGVNPQELGRKHGVSDTTIRNWKAKYGGLTVSEAKRLKSLEDENGRLKRIVANQALNIEALRAVISKNF